MDPAYLCLDLTTKPKRGRKPNEDKKKRRRRNRPGAHIKRAKTGYFYFLDYFRKNYNKDADHISKASEITKACGAAWQAMSVDEREPFQKLARKDRERYEAEMSVYKKERDPDKPKKPPTAYFYFLEDFRKEMKGKTVKGKRVTELCGEQWNQLTDEQKRPYMERVAVQYKKYQEAMEVYRQKKAMEASAGAANPPMQVPQANVQMMGNEGANHSTIGTEDEEFDDEDEDDLEEDEEDGDE
ncbi:high mobility group protein B1-like [Anneissia japonica]|uniref:high mobility group protein B1-like n=1 Tax=Anneissia japonica TaxID=1529436 RepID=UPI00142580E5|nr:high mobility group protein B1-like [Anneissia japonica]